MNRRLLVGFAALLGAVVIVQEAYAEWNVVLPMTLDATGKTAVWNGVVQATEQSLVASGTSALATTARAGGVALFLRGAAAGSGWGLAVAAAPVVADLIWRAIQYATDPNPEGVAPRVEGPFFGQAGPWHWYITTGYMSGSTPIFAGASVVNGAGRSITGTLAAGMDWDNDGNGTAESTARVPELGYYSGDVLSGTFADGQGIGLTGPTWYQAVRVEGSQWIQWHEAVTTDATGGPDDRYSDTWDNAQLKQMVEVLDQGVTNPAPVAVSHRSGVLSGFESSSPETLPPDMVVMHQDQSGDWVAGYPDEGDNGDPAPSPSPSMSPSPSPSSSPSSDPSASPSPSVSPTPSPSPSSSPRPEEENFIIHFWNGVQGKFPLDFFGSFSDIDEQPWIVEFLGYEFSFETIHPWVNAVVGVVGMGICWGLIVSL